MSEKLMWFRANRFVDIEEREIAGYTTTQVKLLNGRREHQNTDWYWWRPTREEVKACVIEWCEGEIDTARRRLQNCEDRLAKAQNA